MGPPDQKYEGVEFVAQGGMARVYRARRRDTGEIVAVREISGGPGSEDRLASEHRGAEIQRALCEIDGRVPKVFDIFTSAAGWLYVEMAYIDGEDLSTIIQRGALAADEAVRIAIELFDFLRIAHTTPVSVDGERRNQQVHGDLTPRNVRIAADGAVRILDFGIAKGLKTTFTAASFANYGYVSPERARSGQMGISDDFWSAGIVLYEMLSGRRAFPGTLEEISSTLADRRSPPPLDESVPRALRLIVTKLLAWDPAYRYVDAPAVLADLHSFRDRRPTSAETEADASRTRLVVPPIPRRDETVPRIQVPPLPVTHTSVPNVGKTTTPAVARTSISSISKAAATNVSKTTPVPQRRRVAPQRRWPVRAGAILVGVVIALHEGAVWQDADARRRLAATQTGELETLWSDYLGLRDRAWLPLTTRLLGYTVADRMVMEASTALKDYRQDEPRIRSRQVEAAVTQLTRALIADPDNRTAKAWLRYAQGHIARIEGEDQRGDERRVAWGRAAARFEESSQLAPDLPDPHLALARLYSHREYRDSDRARRAIAAAEKLGHPRGLREHAQLGDLFRDEGDLLYRQAREVRGTGSEEPLLVRARAELASALGEYEQSKGFGQSNQRIKEINSAARRIDARLDELRVQTASAAANLAIAQASQTSTEPARTIPDRTLPAGEEQTPQSGEESPQ